MTRFLHKGKKYSLQGMIAIAAITLGGCSSIDMREAIHGVARGIAHGRHHRHQGRPGGSAVLSK